MLLKNVSSLVSDLRHFLVLTSFSTVRSALLFFNLDSLKYMFASMCLRSLLLIRRSGFILIAFVNDHYKRCIHTHTMFSMKIIAIETYFMFLLTKTDLTDRNVFMDVMLTLSSEVFQKILYT